MFLAGGDIDITKYCGDIVSLQNIDKNLESKHYSHNMLEWLRCFDTITKQRILLSRTLYLKGEFLCPRLTKVSGHIVFALSVRPSVCLAIRLAVRVYVPLFVDTTPLKL